MVNNMAYLSKEQKIDELTDWIIESMDMSALEDYAKQQLEEYYLSPEGIEDFNTNYEEMREIKGDD
jgi:hypothetical protein